MPKAGYCKECGKNIWLNSDGTGQCGHSSNSISNVYDPEQEKIEKLRKKEKSKRIVKFVIALSIASLILYFYSLFLAPFVGKLIVIRFQSRLDQIIFMLILMTILVTPTYLAVSAYFSFKEKVKLKQKEQSEQYENWYRSLKQEHQYIFSFLPIEHRNCS